MAQLSKPSMAHNIWDTCNPAPAQDLFNLDLVLQAYLAISFEALHLEDTQFVHVSSGNAHVSPAYSRGIIDWKGCDECMSRLSRNSCLPSSLACDATEEGANGSEGRFGIDRRACDLLHCLQWESFWMFPNIFDADFSTSEMHMLGVKRDQLQSCGTCSRTYCALPYAPRMHLKSRLVMHLFVESKTRSTRELGSTEWTACFY